MLEIKETCYKGTRILLGNEKQEYLTRCREFLISNGYTEIQIPIIQYQEIFKNKVGKENNNQMFNFKDRGDRDICLAPEYTAVIQKLANTYFKNKKNVRLFYVAECFRGETPQAGRYREFTQLGVEVINPTNRDKESQILPQFAAAMVEYITTNYTMNFDASRGLDYYKDGKGFEISCEELGSSKQVCGGGEYDEGIGFALGVDRLINLIK